MLNDETREICEFIFKDQLEKAEPLTRDKIEELSSSKTIFGHEIIEEEKLLYFLQEKENGIDGRGMKSIKYDMNFFMYPSELEKFSVYYNFVRFNKLPFFIKHPL